MTKELTCIGCPMGCRITVTMDGDTVVNVEGQTCKKGEIYAQKEVTAPTRIVTSLVSVKGGVLPKVSVKTREDVPKDSIFACMEAIHALEVSAPVTIGDVLLTDIAGTGVDLIATKDIPACAG